MNGIIGRKLGMTSIYDQGGNNVACTVVEAGPNVVTEVIEVERNGYNALQLGFGEAKTKNATKPMRGHYDKAKTGPKSILREFRNFEIEKGLGDVIRVEEVFREGDYVNAIGNSKGRGFQGVVKRHGFHGVGDRSHGQHDRERAPGSIGASSDPSRVFKGMRMGGRMGNKRTTIKNLEILKIFPDENIMLIKGAIPGTKGSFVIIEK